MSLGAHLSNLETCQIHDADNVLALQHRAWKPQENTNSFSSQSMGRIQNFKYACETQIPSELPRIRKSSKILIKHRGWASTGSSTAHYTVKCCTEAHNINRQLEWHIWEILSSTKTICFPLPDDVSDINSQE